MQYQYDINVKTSKKWKDSNAHEWGYVKAKQKNCFADAYKKSRVTSKERLILDEQKLELEPTKKRLGMFERTIGYIPCIDGNGNSGYIRIIAKSPFKIITTLIVLLALMAGGLFYFKQAVTPAADDPIKIKSGQVKNPNPANIMVPGIEAFYLKAGQKHITQPLLNVEGNAYDLTYTIALKETGEILYTSQTIKPGYGVKEFDINRTFKKGTYPVTVTVNSSAKEDRKQKDKDKQVAYNAGRLNTNLIVR